MDTSLSRNASGAHFGGFAIVFHDSARALRRLAERLDTWLLVRQRAGQDRRDLAGMSERELADIGLYRGNFDVAARPMRDDDLRW
jgi:uncharacterized protein YjiS (DUF1127 family)